MTTYTHPEVFDRGVQEGWADPQADPTQIDWSARQARAAIPFAVLDGRPVNPCERTGVHRGRNQLGHWGEQLAADAVVTVDAEDGRHLVMVERTDGHGWALPGGYVEPGEDPGVAALRELREETGLALEGVAWSVLPARYVPDPRASDEAWMVTVPVRTHVGVVGQAEWPAVAGADDAARAAWVRADTYAVLVADLQATYQGRVFAAHEALLQDLLAAAGERRS
jgi:ADP-ribose pyrophosphatase YjhB (NUDIX family)